MSVPLAPALKPLWLRFSGIKPSTTTHPTLEGKFYCSRWNIKRPSRIQRRIMLFPVHATGLKMANAFVGPQTSRERDHTTIKESMDPLIAPMHHNAMHSPLCGLPESILLRIMSLTDHVSLFCLRRTCRTFMRLFSDRQFRRLHDDTIKHWAETNWPMVSAQTLRWKSENVQPSLKSALRLLIQKDMYCTTCRIVRPNRKQADSDHKSRIKLLYCSACATKHPINLFSHRQQQEDSRSRICIGREGNVRICEHVVLTWADIQTLRGERHDLEIDCEDESHLQLSDSSSTCNSSAESAGIRTRSLQHCCNAAGIVCDSTRRRQHLAVPGIVIRWEVHMQVPGAGLTDSLEGADFNRQVGQLRENGGECLVTKPPGRHNVESRPFDPNVCSCVDFLGCQDGDWRFRSRETGRRLACISHGPGIPAGEEMWWDCGPTTKLNEWHHDSAKHSWHYHQSFKVKKCESSTDCFQINYGKHILLTPCRPCHGPKVFKRETMKPTCYNWIAALDPESYGIQDDSDRYGVDWCDTDTCLNHHRFHAMNLARNIASSYGRWNGKSGGRRVWGSLRGLFSRK